VKQEIAVDCDFITCKARRIAGNCADIVTVTATKNQITLFHMPTLYNATLIISLRPAKAFVLVFP